MWIGGKKTNVQIIVTKNIIASNGMSYTKQLLTTFDLDFCRMAIYCHDYVKLLGGADTLFVFMDAKNRRENSRPKNENYSQKTLNRSRKYVSRLNYNHFCQYPIPLENMPGYTFDEINLDRDINQTISHIRVVNEE